MASRSRWSVTTSTTSRRAPTELLRELQAGKNIALVSDAGTPLIADPGYRLVEQAREQGDRCFSSPWAIGADHAL